MTIDVTSLLDRHAAAVESWLRDELPRVCNFAAAPTRLVEAVNYSLLAGGKRLRPALVLEACHACGGDVTHALPAAAAIELIHTFSLVHDDLPAMDDDALRRGRPTSHVQFGEATAILAGDAMTALAFEVLARSYADNGAMIAELARATGPVGMIGGQQLDIDAEGTPLDLDRLRDLHARKTGALIVAACVLGGQVAGADVAPLRQFGRHLGLAFQIRDDVLDVTATPEAMGKATAKDAAAGKNTYPVLLGLDAATQLAHDEAAAAIGALSSFNDAADALRGLARFAASRTR